MVEEEEGGKSTNMVALEVVEKVVDDEEEGEGWGVGGVGGEEWLRV